MTIVYDVQKSERNEIERGLPFELVQQFEWDTAILRQDMRRDYGEVRLLVTALQNGKLYVAVVTPRGSDLRVISLRKASKRERRLYDENRGGG